MPRDGNGNGGGNRRAPSRNVLGERLESCSIKPMTGFFRNGCCDTSREDVGSHTVCIVVLPPIYVPADPDKDELEAYRRLVEEQMARATRLAEEWVETGVRPAALAAGAAGTISPPSQSGKMRQAG